MSFDVLAAIDLHEGRVVRLRQGDFEDVTTHGLDPLATAVDLVAAGARWLHVVDLDGARVGQPVQARAIAAIVRAVDGRAAVEAGGGIRDDDAAGRLLDAGVTRIVLGTAAIRDPAFAGRLVRRLGVGRVAVAIDVRAGRAVGDAWQAGSSDADPAAALKDLAEAGVRTFEVTAVERDGTLEGPDLGLLRDCVGLGGGAVIASGGIRSIEDLEAVRDTGCAGAIVGRALYEGRLDLRQAMARLALDAGGRGR